MHSILEHEPELVHGVGLITVRWSGLEHRLAMILNLLTKVPSGSVTYYTLANFSQRIDVVERLLLNSLHKKRHRAIVIALFGKIKRLWKSRNYLIHSQYGYVWTHVDGRQQALVGGKGATHPAKVGPKPPRDGSPITPVRDQGFAYETYGTKGHEWVMVNKGTFQNHADQLGKRTRQLETLWRAIKNDRAPLWPQPDASDYESLVQQLRDHQEDSERP